MKGINYKVQVRRNALSIHMPHTFMGTDERLQQVRSCRTRKDVKMSIDKGNLHQRLFFRAEQQ